MVIILKSLLTLLVNIHRSLLRNEIFHIDLIFFFQIQENDSNNVTCETDKIFFI